MEAGGSPEFVDKVSMESAFDVAQNEEVRAVLVSHCTLYFAVLRFWSCVCEYVLTTWWKYART